MTNPLENWYLELANEQRVVATQLRDLVKERQPHLREEINWNQPCFYGTSLVCYIQKAKGHMALGFGQGARLADPDGLLDGSGGQMRHVKLPLGKTFDQTALRRLVDEAVELDRAA